MTEEERSPTLPRASRELVERARQLRKGCTLAEQLLWGLLRRTQLHGKHFRRQHPIGTFIVDFYCDEARLIVEIDGAVHREPSQQERDRVKEAVLHEYSLSVLRFTNEEVLSDTERVVQAISRFVLAHSHGSGPLPLAPSPGAAGEGGERKR